MYSINDEKQEVFLAVLLRGVASEQTRLALWLLENPGDLPLGRPIGSDSPFGSGSKLAGYGYLFDLTIEAAEQLLTQYTETVLWQMTHFEIQQNDQILFQSYDFFEVLLLNHLPQTLRQKLVLDGLIFES